MKEEPRWRKSVKSNWRIARRARAQERNALTLLSRHKPKRPEGTNSVVAASRTEERSSFYHVSREMEGKGRGYDAGGGERCSKSRRGRRRESTEESQIILTQDDTRQPLFLLLPPPSPSRLLWPRRSDFRPIKSPRWRGTEEKETSLRGLGESRFRISREIRSISACLHFVARATSLILPSRARMISLFFPPRFLPLLLRIIVVIVVVVVIVVSAVSYGDRVLNHSGPSNFVPRREKIIGVGHGREWRSGRWWSIERSSVLHTQVSSLRSRSRVSCGSMPRQKFFEPRTTCPRRTRPERATASVHWPLLLPYAVTLLYLTRLSHHVYGIWRPLWNRMPCIRSFRC